MIWKFTRRDGLVTYSHDPYEWFDDWDLEAGDREEPTPFCSDPAEFSNR